MDENVVNRGSTKTAKAGKGKTIEEIYTKKTQLEHILLRPDTYIGSIEKQSQALWVFDPSTRRIINRQVVYVPGLYKIFDEIIVNAADNKQRDPTMNRIDVTIDQVEGSIRVWNNGAGIPVVMHAEENIYVPELIFGHLLTGSNFDDNEQKTTGGRNGYGSKLANIFSTRFIIETSDSSTHQKFKQEFRDNMSKKTDPVINPSSSSDYTCITFFPDLKRFKMDCLDDDIVALLSKRVYDMAGTVLSTGAKLSVFLNGSRVEARNFEQYISLYDGLQPNIAFEKVSDRWEIGIGLSDGSFQQVSFVNSIATTKGGSHVTYIADQVTSKLVGIVKKRNKGVEVKANQIKNHLAIFVNALIVNPAFDSQTKENLSTKSSNFGSSCTISDKLMKTIEKSGIIENVLNWAKFKQTAELKKKSGAKKSKILGITKLDDANYAGTAKSKDCSLILTEGDSAKTLAISGLSIVGRDYYGVFPLKGKLLNVREASHQQIMKNEEIQNIVTILGLTFGKEYSDASSLRYGHLLIMTDQDHDGSHIKGLLINFIHHFWPSLLQVHGFLQQFITPIVKCIRGRKEETFFTIPQYQMWKENNHDGKGWKIKYYKGLGTSTAAEAKEYFSDLCTHVIDFIWDEKANDMIDMAFAKKRVEDRKFWLLGNEVGTYMDYNVDTISYDDFVNKELILFSAADNERSIPHYMDGLKPSQRKVLFSCFKRNLKNEIKVAQLAGYISEHSAYHHGEASLTQTIIGMAQNYIGSNNINLLTPCGQFGTRLMGGKDAASPRYVFTKLEKITRAIFHPLDDPLLHYLDDDGQSIEPSFYVPVIPMVLVNGSEGIGTGWSTSVTTYNPRDIITCLRQMISGQNPNELYPWYRGFSGEIQIKTGNTMTPTYVISGKVDVVDDSTIVISELPVGKWTSEYKQFLESVMIGAPSVATNKEDGPQQPVVPFVKDFKENHTDTTVLFTISIPPEKLAEIMNEKGGLQKKLKLDITVSTSNMHMFDNNSIIKKFEGPLDVLNAFYGVRTEFYSKRKNHLLNKLTDEWEKLDNKVKFIEAVIDGKIIVSNRKKTELLNDLLRLKFKLFSEKTTLNDSNASTSNNSSSNAGAGNDTTDENELMESSSSDLEKGYDYLLGMKIWSLTHEKVVELSKLRDDKRKELSILTGKTSEDLWIEDLDNLEIELDEFEHQIEEANQVEAKHRRKAQANRSGKSSSKAHAKKSIKKRTTTLGDDDDDDLDDDDDDFDNSDESDFENSKKSKKAPVKKPIVITRPVLAEKSLTSISKPQVSTQSISNLSSLATKPLISVPKITSAPKAIKSSKPTIVHPEVVVNDKDGLDDDDDDLNGVRETSAPMSLLERIKMKQASSGISSSLTTTSSILSSKPKSSVTSKLVTKAAKSYIEIDSDDENNDDIFKSKSLVTKTTAVTKPINARTARPKTKKSYDEDDDLSMSDNDQDEDVFDDDDDDDDFSDDSDVPKRKPKSKPKAPTASVSTKPLPKVISTINTAKNTTTIRKTNENKGIKREKKGSTTMDDDEDMYSPVKMISPDNKKKPRKIDSDASSSHLISKLPTKSIPKSIPKAVPKVIKDIKAKKSGTTISKKNLDSDEELNFDDDGESVVATQRTPKPSRQRKPTNYAIYDEDDEDVNGMEEDSFIVEDDSEEDESDYDD